VVRKPPAEDSVPTPPQTDSNRPRTVASSPV